jgi:hypothetical protein
LVYGISPLQFNAFIQKILAQAVNVEFRLLSSLFLDVFCGLIEVKDIKFAEVPQKILVDDLIPQARVRKLV